MKIYHVSHDPSYASIIVEKTEGATDISNLQADTIDDFCSPVCRLANPDAKIGHFYFLNDTALVFNKETDIAMGDFIEYAGLIHPLEVEGVGELGLLNIDEVCNPVNKKASETVAGSWQKTIALKKLVFHQTRIASMSSLFKIPELDYRAILTFSEGTTESYSQEHDFYKFYHETNMTGLMFTEIWSSE